MVDLQHARLAWKTGESMGAPDWWEGDASHTRVVLGRFGAGLEVRRLDPGTRFTLELPFGQS